MHPKNSKPSLVTQLPVLRPVDFGACALDAYQLFRIRDDAPLLDGLEMAKSLAEGVHQLSLKVAEEVNKNGVAQVSELRALGFLADAIATLTFSAHLAILKAGDDQ